MYIEGVGGSRRQEGSTVSALRRPSPTYRCRNRLRAVVALLAFAVACAAAAPSVAHAALAYPDLKTLSPRDLRFDRTDVSYDGSGQFHNVLRFTNTVWNAGPGRLENRGDINPQTLTGPAFQRVYDGTTGTFTEFASGGFYWHAQNHNHFHYDDWGRYELWDRADFNAWIASGRTQGAADLHGSKTTSCVMDEEFFRQLPGTPFPAVYPSGGCLLDDDGELIQGLSVGWGDTYDYYRDEQWIDLDQGSLADGQYVLRSVTDPNNKIYESAGKSDPAREGQTANEGIVYFTIDEGEVVDTDAPTGTVAVNNVDPSTATKKVTVKVTGRDDVSGVDQVRVSADGVNWRTHNYTSSGSTPTAILCDLTDPEIGGSPNEGVRTIYAQFKDETGKWGQTESDTIEYAPQAGGPSAYSDAVLADDPAGYWRLGEPSGTTANDSAGDNNGVVAGGAQLGADSLVPGDPANAAVRLDGTNDRVGVEHASELAPTGQMAVEAWIKLEQVPSSGFRGIVVKPETFALQLNNGRLEFTVIQNGVRRRAQAFPGAVVANETYHVVGAYDGAHVRLYLNGSQVAVLDLNGSIGPDAGGELSIGSWDDAQEFLRGAVDEVALYDQSLDASEVEQHYEIGSEPPEEPDPTVDAPSDLTAMAASQTRVELRWSDNAGNETEHVIERDTSAAFGSPDEILLGEGETAYSDTGLTPGTQYFYRVKARNVGDDSDWSNIANATTPATPPPVADGYGQVVLGDGPVSHWRLGETSGGVAIDQRAINPGSYINEPQLGAPGLLPEEGADSAVAFDGIDDYMAVSSSASLGIGAPITLEAWISPSALPAPGQVEAIVGKAGSYALRLDGPQLVFQLTQLGVPKTLAAPVSAIQAGGSHHVVATFDGSLRRLYVDGAEVAEAELAGGATASGGGFYVGSTGGLSDFYGGTVDEAAVYAKALGADRVLAHRKAGIGPPVVAPPPVTPKVGPTPRDCRVAQAHKRRWTTLVNRARKAFRSARRPAVKRRRQKLLVKRKAALKRATTRAKRTCAAVR
jgi:concanavalin A-like lectin/glucanase superfamily protein/fibronectin type III domain protein/lysyl oxidase